MKRTSLSLTAVVALVLISALAAPAASVNCTGVAAWSPNSVAYSVGALVTYQGNEYKCVQAHTSLAGWDPVSVPALWSLVGTCSTGPTPTATPTPTKAPATPTPTRVPATPTPTKSPATPTPTKAPATPTPTVPPGGGANCSGVPTFAVCTAYATGAQVQYKGSDRKSVV